MDTKSEAEIALNVPVQTAPFEVVVASCVVDLVVVVNVVVVALEVVTAVVTLLVGVPGRH